MKNILEKLIEVLRSDDKFISEGSLLKNKIIESALSLDSTLIKLLLKDESIKKTFFENIDGVLVFDKIKFQKFVSNKEFLPDSYTSFSNKIGFTVDSEFLSSNKDVVLSWAYKDCVLEGGQDKDDAKRNEIFWNETLAPDQIDRLLSPKALTSFKKFDKKGESKLDSISENDNLIIKGNNLLALHTIRKKFQQKIKLIYIDPPYNTDSDSFKYNDSFNHSTWLTFIKNRLEVAKELLRPDGLIFIHIGDNELHYLKVLADEIFGRDRFIATIPRKTRSGKSDVPYKLSQDFDWILAYTKTAPKTDSLFQRLVERKYYKSDDFPNDEWRMSDLTKQTTIKERPNSDFTLINPRNGDEYPVNPNRSWSISKDTVGEFLKKKKIVFPGDYPFLNIKQPSMRIFKSEEIEAKGEDFDKSYVSTDYLNLVMDDLLSKTTNKKGTDEIVDLFGAKVFSFPKNELLLSRIIECSTAEGDIVLDFFVGSGTTAAVAHKMNRQYIGIEQMDYIENVTVERLKKVIDGEQGGISEKLGWTGGGSFVYCELMKLNQTYLDQVAKASSPEVLISIWNDMKSKALISYQVSPKSFEKNIEEFQKLSFENQQQFLISILDKNMLYVPYSEIDDKSYMVSNTDKEINQKFFQR